MKLTVDVTGLDKLTEQFSERRLRAAVTTALTRTARDIADDWRKQFATKFDKPTGATLRSVQWKKADPETMEASVSIGGQDGKANPAQWLLPEEVGGPRGTKRFEAALQAQGSMPQGWRVVPGPGAKLDAYGNISRGQIVQVIAQLGAKYSPGYQRVISASAAKRAARARATGRGYMAVLPGQKGKLTPGVYERKGRGLQAVFFYVSNVQYRRATNLIGSAMTKGPAILKGHLLQAIGESAERLRAQSSLP